MNLYDTVKSHVTTRQAAEFYGIQVKPNGMLCCPFHPDRHPSMKVDIRYYCFGCHETGDVIDFVGKLFGLSPYEAAKKLAADFHIDPTTPASAAVSISAYKKMMQQRTKESECTAILIDYECMLKEWKVRFAPSSPADEWNIHFIVKQDANNALLFMESEGYIRLTENGRISAKELYKIYSIWCEENNFSPLKQRSFSDFLIGNQKKYGIEHNNNQTNAAGRRVWGFSGIEPLLKLPMQTCDGWQKDYSPNNPFA